MSDTNKHQKAWQQRADGTHRFNPDPEFDGARYGNRRKEIARLKVKERRAANRAARKVFD